MAEEYWSIVLDDMEQSAEEVLDQDYEVRGDEEIILENNGPYVGWCEEPEKRVTVFGDMSGNYHVSAYIDTEHESFPQKVPKTGTSIEVEAEQGEYDREEMREALTEKLDIMKGLSEEDLVENPLQSMG